MYSSISPVYGVQSESSASSSEHAATEVVSEVTHAATGVTYHFSNPVEVGYYWNGDIFVVNNGGDIIIESITPESNPLSEGRVLNGAVLQPDNDSFTAFDSSGQPSYYRDYSNFESYNVDPGKTGQPLVISYSEYPEGASLVKGVSLEDLSDSRDRSVIEEFSVLTVVKDVPPENAFRPPVSGTDKVSHYTTDDLDFSKLQNVEILENQADISEFDLYTTATFASWTTSADPARYTHPNKYHDGYGDYQMDAMVNAFLALHSNYSDAEKADLYAALVQTGLDYAGTVQAGEVWKPDGGHSNQIKPFVVLAAVGLNSEALAAVADPSTNGYSEDKQFGYVDEALIGADILEYGGNKVSKVGMEYQDAQLGTPEWFIREGGDRADPSLDAAYRWINSDNLPITALVMEMLGNGEGRETWNNEAYFDYADRVQNIYDIEVYEGHHRPAAAWEEFIDAYAQQFSTQPDWEGVPETVSGIEAEANGSGISVSIDGPKYDGGSEIIRTDFRYSTDREDWTVLEGVSSEFTIEDLPSNTLYYVQARYVNTNGEGPWSYNSFVDTNQRIVDALLEAELVTQEEIDQYGGLSQYLKKDHYKGLLSDLLNGSDDSDESILIANLVNGSIITGSGLSFSSGSQYIDENISVGTVIGSLGSVDGGDISYQMIEASDYFSLDGLNIVTKSEINYEEIAEHKLFLQVDDGISVSIEELSIKVNNIAEAVTDFAVSIGPIAENAAVGSVVGTFSAHDDDGENITFRVNANPIYDTILFNEYFNIVGDQVILDKTLDLELFSSLYVNFYTDTPSGLGQNWTPYTIEIVGEPSLTETADPPAPDDGKIKSLYSPTFLVNGAETSEPASYGGKQDAGDAVVSADGSSVSLTNNAWKSIALNQTITADTVLSFEFKADVQGEVHGIGFDTDDTLSADQTFQLAGDQTWGIQGEDSGYVAGGGWQQFDIRVGDYFTGDFDRLVFAMDDDAGVGADSTFRNVEITEEFDLFAL